MNIQTNIPLAQLTTMRLGGNASYVADVTTREELQQIYHNAKQMNQPVYIIGGGSNLIAHDEGFAGVIVHMKIPGIEVVSDDGESTTIRAGGGEVWDNLVKFSVERNLTGIEAMSGIPGTVGAAPVQNIGAYGQELADTFISLEAYDITTDQFVTLSSDECGFAYRHSIFRGEAQGRYAIYSVTLKLWKQAPQPPFYDSLQKRFDALHVTDFTPQIIRENVLAIRADKLPDPAKVANSGSFFKNAIIEEWQLNAIKEQVEDVKYFDQGEGKFKIPAGWLIEACDLRGEVLHGMKVHDANAVVLINESAKSYADLAAARDEIVTAVQTKFQIELQQEPLELNSAPTSDQAI